MKKLPKKGALALTLTGGVLILLLLSLYLGRDGILHYIVSKRTAEVEQRYGLSIHYDGLRMDGLSAVNLQGLSLVPHQRDTLLTLQTLNLRLGFWKLLRGHIEIRNVAVDSLALSFVKKGSVANYDFLFRKGKSSTPDEPTPTNYARRVDELLNLLYGFLPENGELNRLHITERTDSSYVAITVPTFVVRHNRFQSGAEVREDTLTQQWILNGELNCDTHTLQVRLFSDQAQAKTDQGKAKISLPYLNRRFGAEVKFDTLSYSLTQERVGSEQVILDGQADISGLSVYHKALSPEVINLDRGQLAYRINLGAESVELDSATTARFNKMQFHPYLRAAKENGLWHFTASVDKPWFPADDLFSSLPKGLFSNLEGLRADGELSYRFLLDVDFARLDSLRLESEVQRRNFRIVRFGATPLGRMSDEFTYTAYENGQPVRSFPVGPSWEHFTPLDSISPLLQMSVLQSEDGAFYYHHGFLPNAMREALIHDLKVRRFARGGSTITMQLVKNVFLNRSKNIARKLEEALIVWLIETEGLTPKARMYEVYLNIVEWGPQVYGAHEAAAYYFDKRPSQLTAEESIFLASIIPKPKHFRNSFTGADMKLKENMEGYYRLIKERLVKKGLIDEAQADSIRPDIKVTGQARQDFEASPLGGCVKSPKGKELP